MAVRRTKCPICHSVSVQVVEVHNPDTRDMNARATLKCNECQHTWEGQVMSEYHRERQRRGWVR